MKIIEIKIFAILTIRINELGESFILSEYYVVSFQNVN
jgi:hypothetical protein